MRAFRSAALLLLIPLLGTAQLPPRDRGVAPATGDSTITGRVMTSEGRPLARARVLLRSGTTSAGGGPTAPINVTSGRSGPGFWQQLTDDTGQFTFADLPAGTYTLSATHPRYLSAQYAQRFVGQQGRPIELAAGQRLRADLVAVRGGAVTGRVFDEYGEPLSDVPVIAYRYVTQGRQRRLVPAGGRSYASNDLGQFRIANLPPGDFVIAAQYRGEIDPGQRQAASRQGYAPTYYPGTLSPSAAQAVRVMAGGDVPNVDFLLQPTRLVQATGTIVTSSGQPVTGTQLSVTPIDGDVIAASRPAARVLANGLFTATDLPPGEYILTAQHSAADRQRQQAQPGAGGGGQRPESVREYGSLRLSVAGEPIHNLSIQLSPGARVSVRVQSDVPLPGGRMISLTAEQQPGTSQTIAVSGNEAVFHAGPGKYRVMPAGLPEGWVVERVMNGARDITASGLAIADATPLSIVVHVTSRGAALVGDASAGASQAPSDYTIVVLAEDAAERTAAARGVRMARPDQSGQFVLKGLRPGAYLVAAVDYAEVNELYDPAFWARIEPGASRVTLAPGETKRISAPLTSRR